MKPGIEAWLTEQFGDDQALREELYAQYADDMKKYSASVKDKLVEGDLEGVGKLAHTMKGMALQIGDTDTAAACKAVQDTARAGDHGVCVTMYPVVRDLVAAL